MVFLGCEEAGEVVVGEALIVVGDVDEVTHVVPGSKECGWGLCLGSKKVRSFFIVQSAIINFLRQYSSRFLTQNNNIVTAQNQ